MIAIIDYGVGNLFSLKSSFATLTSDVIVTSSVSEAEKADKIVLPGVGAFADAADKLRKSGLGEVVATRAKKGVPLLGICLGMQLLFDKSYEYGEYEGLGLIHGNVRPMSIVVPSTLKIPHMGWNALSFKKQSRLFESVKEGEHVYFVHSYYATDCDESVVATAEYGAPITAAVENGNVYGCQFHPEKSGEVGLKILKNFVEMR